MNSNGLDWCVIRNEQSLCVSLVMERQTWCVIRNGQPGISIGNGQPGVSLVMDSHVVSLVMDSPGVSLVRTVLVCINNGQSWCVTSNGQS